MMNHHNDSLSLCFFYISFLSLKHDWKFLVENLKCLQKYQFIVDHENLRYVPLSSLSINNPMS